MNQLILHLEYLLLKHDCVIVPGMGGFVVNSTSSRKEDLSIFHNPGHELIFNKLLIHNDGLIAESYMRAENISFELASHKIEKSVNELRDELKNNKRVSLNGLGTFEINSDNLLIFKSFPFIRPDNFGLQTTSLKPILQLKPKNNTASKPFIEKKNALSKISISTAAAAIIAILFLIIPIQDSVIEHQSAQILSESSIFAKSNKQKNRSSEYLASTQLTDQNEIANSDDIILSSNNNDNKYIVIVGVYEIRDIADKMIDRLKSDGFINCNSIERSNRIDVYADGFSTREEAETIAREMRQKFEIYSEAWVKELKIK